MTALGEQVYYTLKTISVAEEKPGPADEKSHPETSSSKQSYESVNKCR